MQNSTLKDNPAIMTIICNIQNMSKILNKDISFEYLQSKKYSVLQEIQDQLIPQYNAKIS